MKEEANAVIEQLVQERPGLIAKPFRSDIERHADEANLEPQARLQLRRQK